MNAWCFVKDLAAKVAANTAAIETLNSDIGELTDDVTALENAALIEDYFEVNDMLLDLTGSNTPNTIGGPFCVEADSVLIFTLAYNIVGDNDRVPNVDFNLIINNVIVASANANDTQAPSNVAIFYEQYISVDSEVVAQSVNVN